MKELGEIVEGMMLLVSKPEGWSSFDVVNKIKAAVRHTYQLKKFKIGHAGTLDPLASGLLIICTGRMTKQIESYQGQTKYYRGVIKLGATTPSYDRETEEDAQYRVDHITQADIEKAAEQLTGEIMQKPPMFSAIKKNGVRLYKMARARKQMKIEPRKVLVSSFDITGVDLPLVSFEVICSKGTYIRSLAYDLGKELKSGGYLMELERTGIGDYRLEDAWDVHELTQKIRDQT